MIIIVFYCRIRVEFFPGLDCLPSLDARDKKVGGLQKEKERKKDNGQQNWAMIYALIPSKGRFSTCNILIFLPDISSEEVGFNFLIYYLQDIEQIFK